uniref:Core-binding (CB) domain-containing protein n=1 Tax=Lepisosteus oculatus TaxID=7918 RepID=W5LYD8_LEPOC
FKDHFQQNEPYHHYLQLARQTILSGIAPRTLNSYWTAWKGFQSFHLSANIKFPSFDILTVSSFLCYCRNSLKVRASTTKVYLCSIHFFHKLLFGTTCPSLIHPQITLLLKGFQWLRHPESCIYVLRSVTTDTVDRTLESLFLSAFFGFLRCSEITAASTSFDPSSQPCLSDISILSSDTLTFYLMKSKTNQLRSGTLNYFFKLCSYVSPYESLSHYAHLRTAAGALPTDPLFVNEKGCILTRDWFLSHLYDILLTAGYPPEQFSGHS